MILNKKVAFCFFVITGVISTDTFAVGGSITNIILDNVVCENINTGQTVTILNLRGSTTWDCTAYGLKTAKGDTIKETLRGIVEVASSCKEILANNPYSASGAYLIQSIDSIPPFKTYCDMTTDGGGWTLVAKIFELTLPTKDYNTTTLITDAQPARGQEGKLADAAINALGYEKVRVIPSGAPTYITYFFKPTAAKVWDFTPGGAGNLNGIPVCENAALTFNCVIRNGIIDGNYAGYRNWCGINDHAFILNHPSNLGYAGRVPYTWDTGVSATIWVR